MIIHKKKTSKFWHSMPKDPHYNYLINKILHFEFCQKVSSDPTRLPQPQNRHITCTFNKLFEKSLFLEQTISLLAYPVSLYQFCVRRPVGGVAGWQVTLYPYAVDILHTKSDTNVCWFVKIDVQTNGKS